MRDSLCSPNLRTEVTNINIYCEYIYSPWCCRWVYIGLNSVLVVCCGLLAKWLRVRVRAGARECIRYTFFFWSYKCGEHVCLRWFGSLRIKVHIYITYNAQRTCQTSESVNKVNPHQCFAHDYSDQKL